MTRTRKQQLEIAYQISQIIRQKSLIYKKVENIKRTVENFNSSKSSNDLRILKLALEKLVEEHDSINNRLLSLIDESEIEKETENITKVDNFIRDVQSQILDFLDQLKSDSNVSSENEDETMIPSNHVISSTMIHPSNLNDSVISQNVPHSLPEIKPVITQSIPSSNIIESNRVLDNVKSINFQSNPVLQNAPQVSVQSSSIQNVVSQTTYISNNQAVSFKSIHIKTPTIEIPVFDGNPLKWLTFKQMFESIIHNRNDIDDIVKFTYLLKHLSGKATSGLGHITLTSEGYQYAWTQLLSEYDNNCILVDTHIDNILNLPYCNREHSTDLRNLFNLCQLHVSTLNALNFQIDSLSERMLVNIVRKRLDVTTRKLWEEKQQSNNFPSWNALLTFIQRRYQILESIESCKKPLNLKSSDNSKSSQKSSSTKVFHTVDSSHNNNSFKNNDSSKKKFSFNKPNNTSCYICNKNNHKIFNCLNFLKLSPFERLNKIKAHNACINCLNKGHLSKDCTSSSNCRKQ